MTAGRKVCGAETDQNRRAGAPGYPPPETGGIAERGWNTFQHYSATSGILSEVGGHMVTGYYTDNTTNISPVRQDIIT